MHPLAGGGDRRHDHSTNARLSANCTIKAMLSTLRIPRMATESPFYE
jgi:hypothetical protein